jgi:hypothetical protein
MIQRGRKSAASLSIVSAVNRGLQRPQPSSEMSPEEKTVWRETTEALRPDWFKPESLPLLRAYCWHVTMERRLAAVLRKFDEKTNLAEFDRLTTLYLRESAALVRLATKLRLTIQSSASARRTKHVSGLPKPWEL